MGEALCFFPKKGSMRSRTAPDFAGRCPECRLRLEYCLCAEVPTIDPGRDFEIVVVRHAIEGLKSSNTARIAALALPCVRIVEYGGKGNPIDADSLVAGANSCLMYPTTDVATPPLANRLIVLDGNWTQARRMLLRMTPLHALPRLSVAAPPSNPIHRTRQTRDPTRMSTIEAIAGALDALSLDGGKALRELAELFALRVMRMRGR